MSTQTAENRSQTTPEPLPAALVDHDALYEAVKRLLRNGKVIVRHIEENSADVHRDLAGMKAAIAEADQLLNPVQAAGPEDAIVLYARSVVVGDHVWGVKGEGWAEVRGAHQHELYPDRVQLNLLHGDEPSAYGFRREEILVVRRRPTPAAAVDA